MAARMWVIVDEDSRSGGASASTLALHYAFKALYKAVEAKQPEPDVLAEVTRLISRALLAVQNNTCEIVPELQQTLADLTLLVSASSMVVSTSLAPSAPGPHAI